MSRPKDKNLDHVEDMFKDLAKEEGSTYHNPASDLPEGAGTGYGAGTDDVVLDMGGKPTTSPSSFASPSSARHRKGSNKVTPLTPTSQSLATPQYDLRTLPFPSDLFQYESIFEQEVKSRSKDCDAPIFTDRASREVVAVVHEIKHAWSVPEPKEEPSAYNLGLSQRLKRNYNEAIANFNQELANIHGNKDLDDDKKQPMLAKIYHNIGKIWIATNNPEEAIRNYNLAIDSYSVDSCKELSCFAASAYHERGLSYHSIGRYEDTIVDFDMAVKTYPDKRQTHYEALHGD